MRNSALLSLLLPLLAAANLAVKTPFTSSMVLQRNQVNPIWGTASPGEAVTVTLGGQTKSALTGSNGKWTVRLDPMAEAGPLTMILKGTNTLQLSDVYVGEVWQVAGQSNMDTRMEFYPNLADSIKHADLPLMRYLTLRQGGGVQNNPWLVVSPATVKRLSATGYFFGKEILKTTGVAVGLVVTAVGGTTLEAWLDPATLAAHPSIHTTDQGTMWNAWTGSVAGYGIKGTAWIQGEQNCNAIGAPNYGERFKLLIQGWRAAWGQGDFPFYFGQLSGTTGAPDPNKTSYVAMVREGQRQALALPQTAMSVNMDIGNWDNTTTGWHYPDKPDAGFRLSLPAKALLYGRTDLEYSGPLFQAMTLSGNQAKLVFTHMGSGLVAKGPLSGFAIAAATGAWVWGDAVLKGDTVIVSSPSIAQPAKVRYAWSDKPIATLYNREGLPASPFTTEAPAPAVLHIWEKRPSSPALRTVRPGFSIPGFPGLDALGRWDRKRESLGP